MEGQYKQLAELFLPIGILDYFDLVNTSKVGKEIKIYLEEKNTVPEEYKGQQLHSKCFLPEITVQDFPIRGQKVALCIKRRRWEVVSSEEIVSRNWTLVREGTRMTTENPLSMGGIGTGESSIGGGASTKSPLSTRNLAEWRYPKTITGTQQIPVI